MLEQHGRRQQQADEAHGRGDQRVVPEPSQKFSMVVGSSVPKLACTVFRTTCSAATAASEKCNSSPRATSINNNSGTSEIRA